MARFLLLFLWLFQQTLSAQKTNEFTRFSILPNFSVGTPLIGMPKITSGNQQLQPIFNLGVIGSLETEDGSSFENKLNNQMGLDLLYSIDEQSSFGAGMKRTALVYSMVNPVIFNRPTGGFTESYEKWVEMNRFYSVGGFVQRKFGSVYQPKFIKVGLWSTIFKYEEGSTGLQSTINPYVNIELIDGPKRFGYVSLEAGKQFNDLFFFQDPTLVSLGLDLPFSSFYSNRFYFENAQAKATNEVVYSGRALWVKLGIPINIKTKEKKPKKKSPKETVVYEGKKVKSGETFILRNLQFGQSSNNLNAAAMGELDRLAEFLKDNPSVVIQIAGHTSSEGDRLANIKLSEKRANSCKDYLKKKGVKAKRIEVKGFGPDRPIDVRQPQLNRRVEFRILKM